MGGASGALSEYTGRPMKIGSVEISALARLAPMAGITNAPFRLIARECGSGLTTSEERSEEHTSELQSQ